MQLAWAAWPGGPMLNPPIPAPSPAPSLPTSTFAPPGWLKLFPTFPLELVPSMPPNDGAPPLLWRAPLPAPHVQARLVSDSNPRAGGDLS
jgi:hypothetical protein